MATVHGAQARGKAVEEGVWVVSCSLLCFGSPPPGLARSLAWGVCMLGWLQFSEAPDLLHCCSWLAMSQVTGSSPCIQSALWFLLI